MELFYKYVQFRIIWILKEKKNRITKKSSVADVKTSNNIFNKVLIIFICVYAKVIGIPTVHNDWFQMIT
jgi:hypothetical protein